MSLHIYKVINIYFNYSQRVIMASKRTRVKLSIFNSSGAIAFETFVRGKNSKNYDYIRDSVSRKLMDIECSNITINISSRCPTSIQN
jgi:hypothetical protein